MMFNHCFGTTLKFWTAGILALIFGAMIASAQLYPKMGMPPIKNFTPANYQDKGKIWDIRSAPNGIVYMAADRGLLEFDGKNWHCFKGSEGCTRSLTIINDSLIYTGSDMDFGVWERTQSGTFNYRSLYPFRNEVQDINEEFWNVHHLNKDVFFVSAKNIYLYRDQQLVKIKAPSRISSCFVVNGILYFADDEFGLHVFENLSLKNVVSYPRGMHLDVVGLYHHKGGIVIVTRNSGLFFYDNGQLVPYDREVSEWLKTAKVFSFEQADDKHVAYGTVMKGLFITDLEGNMLHQINKYKGLLSNTILCLHQSSTGKLWIAMDYGVSSLQMNTKITYFNDYRGDYGTGYTALVSGDDFYLGTNQGLYRSAWDDLNNSREFTNFQLIPGTEGQVWSLKEIDNVLFIGHDRGLFTLMGGSMKRLSDFEGVWAIQQYRDYLLAGTYNGIEIFRKSNKDWVYQNKMELISGSCNQLIIEGENILWVNIPTYGIIRAVLDENLFPNERMIFPLKEFQGYNPYLFFSHQAMQVITDESQYVFDAQGKQFHLEEKALVPEHAENLMTGTYQSTPLHQEYDFLPVYNGFALKYLKYKGKDVPEGLSLLFRRVEAYDNRERISVYSGFNIPFRFNNLAFEFAVPNRDDMLYQYKLDESGEWSSWSTECTAELINLKAGDHMLFVRAKTNGEVAAENEFSFHLTVPWYRSWIAIVIWIGIVVFGAFMAFYWQRLLLKKQKKKLLLKEQNSLRQQAEKHKEKIMLLEQEQLQKEYYQIKHQLKSKTIELANKSKDNESKNRLLQSLKEKFDDLENEPINARIRLIEMRRLLDTYSNQEDRTFEIQMDELHQEFFKKLKENFPSLSGNDLRLCAYLRVGLTSKEIADILNIQPSSAYISRSRLRKKLNLKANEDLYDFLNKI